MMDELTESNTKQVKPLYDARAKYSSLLVDKLTQITKYLEVGEVDSAFRVMVNYYHLTHPYMKPQERKKEITEDINKCNDLRENYREQNYDTDQITERAIDSILPKLTDYTSHLLLPMQDSDSDLDEDDL